MQIPNPNMESLLLSISATDHKFFTFEKDSSSSSSS